ncbi:hypothetical protein KF728_20540 [Candidatus Obscuribacterales bacterium]|nr:hypothetical protein [Candidatus Obscuribacterales bacterium]
MSDRAKEVGTAVAINPSNIKSYLDEPSVTDCPFIFISRYAPPMNLAAIANGGRLASRQFNLLYKFFGFLASPLPFAGLILSCFVVDWYAVAFLAVLARLVDPILDSTKRLPFSISRLFSAPLMYLSVGPIGFGILSLLLVSAWTKRGFHFDAGSLQSVQSSLGVFGLILAVPILCVGAWFLWIVINVRMGQNSFTNKGMHAHMQRTAVSLAKPFAEKYFQKKKEMPDATDAEIFQAIRFNPAKVEAMSSAGKAELHNLCKTANGLCYMDGFETTFKKLSVARSIQFTFYVDRALEEFGMPKITKTQKREVLSIWGLDVDGWENHTPEGRTAPMQDDTEVFDDNYPTESELDSTKPTYEFELFSESYFQAVAEALKDSIENLPAIADEDKVEILKTLFLQTAGGVYKEVVRIVTSSSERLKTDDYDRLLLEAFTYVCFYIDLCAFKSGQSKQSREFLRDIFEDQLLEPKFFSRDENLRTLFVSRLEQYIKCSGERVSAKAPQKILLLAVSESSELKDRDSELISLQDEMPSFSILLSALNAVFESRRELLEISPKELVELLNDDIEYSCQTKLVSLLGTSEYIATA